MAFPPLHFAIMRRHISFLPPAMYQKRTLLAWRQKRSLPDFSKTGALPIITLMHHAILSLFPLATSATPLAARQIRPLISLLPSELPNIMALAKICAATAAVDPFLCGIINAKSGRCAENCAFCAQSVHHEAKAPVYPLVSRDALLAKAEELAAIGARHMGIVISGTRPTDSDFERLLEDAAHITGAVSIKLCASFGLLRGDQATSLRQAGFTGYHHNIETARSYYPKICGTHAYEARENTVRLARQAGLRVCCGGIFGLGESWEQRLEMATAIAGLDPQSIPINFLNPIPGTPLAQRPALPVKEALAIVSIMRLMHPGRDIVICGGRNHVLGDLDALLFGAGANGLMTGHYLTTTGSPYERDLNLFRALGLDSFALPRK